MSYRPVELLDAPGPAVVPAPMGDELTPEEAEAIIDAADAAAAEAVVAAAEAAAAEAAAAEAAAASQGTARQFRADEGRAGAGSGSSEEGTQRLRMGANVAAMLTQAEELWMSLVFESEDELRASRPQTPVPVSPPIALDASDIRVIPGVSLPPELEPSRGAEGVSVGVSEASAPAPSALAAVAGPPAISDVSSRLVHEPSGGSEEVSAGAIEASAAAVDLGFSEEPLINIRKAGAVVQKAILGSWKVVYPSRRQQGGYVPNVVLGHYPTEDAAQAAADALVPPVLRPAKWGGARCVMCKAEVRAPAQCQDAASGHCLNCGRVICGASSCIAFWPKSMLPPLYTTITNTHRIRVCRTCYTTGEKFRVALLKGSVEDAMAAHRVGCVNLRSPYTVYHGEYPVHCAAAGGSVRLLAWLIEELYCPIGKWNDEGPKELHRWTPLEDGRGLTVFGAAVVNRRIDTMRYLLHNQPCEISEVTHVPTLRRALTACLLGDDPNAAEEIESTPQAPAAQEPSTPSPQDEDDENDGSCIVCFDNPVDCTLVPCGHHCCCLDCSSKFDKCPVCRKNVVDRIHTINI